MSRLYRARHHGAEELKEGQWNKESQEEHGSRGGGRVEGRQLIQ